MSAIPQQTLSAHSRSRKGEIGGGASVNSVWGEDHKGLDLAVGREIRGGPKRHFTGNIGHRRRESKRTAQQNRFYRVEYPTVLSGRKALE